MYDILVLNGIYPDFQTGEMKHANIGIKDCKIAYVGTETPEAGQVIDASGKVVSPGFVDIHMHEENFSADGKQYIIANMMLEMGVTTAVGGNCGSLRQSIRDFKAILEEKGGSPVNYVMLAGYNSSREKIGVSRHEVPTEEQKKLIHEDLRKEMAEGAFGISFGIEYDPAMTYEEILEGILQVSEDPNHIVSAHYREDGPGSVEAVEEMIRIADNIPQKFQISHLSSCSAMGTMDEVLGMINEAMERNPKLDYDTYPYNAFSTYMGSAVFEDGCLEGWGKNYSDILLTDDPYKNVFCTEEIFRDARENHPKMLAVAFVMNEEEIAAAIANKKGMIGSDGVLRNGNGHPRAAGTFPRVLGKYVREDKIISLYDALKKMTLLPADRLGLKQKGRLEVGADADLTIFDPETILDGATYSELKPPKGIEYVIIDGEIVLKDGTILNARKGRFIPYKNA